MPPRKSRDSVHSASMNAPSLDLSRLSPFRALGEHSRTHNLCMICSKRCSGLPLDEACPGPTRMTRCQTAGYDYVPSYNARLLAWNWYLFQLAGTMI